MSALSAEEVLARENNVAESKENGNPATVQPSQSSWGWGWKSFSFRNLWIATSNEELIKAERDFIDTFINPEVLEVAVQDVPIYYDVTPIKLRQTKAKARGKNSEEGNRGWNCKPSRNNAVNQNVHPNGTKSSIDLLPPISSNDEKTEAANNVNELDVESILNGSDENHEEPPQAKPHNEHIHTVIFRLKKSNPTRSAVEQKNRSPPIVLLHGYGCAGGIHIPSIHIIFNTLLKKLGREVLDAVDPEIHLIDWLGNGASSRPKFDQDNFTVEDTENWFVDSLEEWRKNMGYQDIILAGHSLGGYMCSVYALRYPERVAHLILVSPAGVAKVPSGLSLDDWLNGLEWKQRFALKTVRSLWNKGWTPHDVVRYSGPKGKDWVHKLVSKRLFRIPDEDPLKPVLSNYLYHVYSGTGSGEYALNKVFQPGAWAWNPLMDRLPQLKVYQRIRAKNMEPKEERPAVESNINSNAEGSNTEEKKSEEPIDIAPPGVIHESRHPTLRVDAIFGETDWMDPTPFSHFQNHNLLDTKIHILRDCGHQLILEQPRRFGKKIGSLAAQCFQDFYDAYLKPEKVSTEAVLNATEEKVSTETVLNTTEEEVVSDDIEQKTPEDGEKQDQEAEESESSEEPQFRGKVFGERG